MKYVSVVVVFLLLFFEGGLFLIFTESERNTVLLELLYNLTTDCNAVALI